ncbi:type VI secretion system-associated protein TagF [Vannielia litorea]|uniref:type VI secretion system-associated protein TagF n=1 Tax=Vannielia litorea TaxID=1217970 RepID=UPI001BCEC189|nr:type VI secretion system-associated protein TagF [Vannielia litorea]MBS8225482.1 type VI secretion system-associated protein TagF [Vannielia litorea]
MPLGLFGKLPAKGDFITRSMPPEVLSFWEAWLEKAMSGAKHHLAGEWAQVYEASPVWRFWIGPGVFGHAMAGALTASVDRVGRQFPLTLVLSGLGHNHPVPPLSDPMEDWYGLLERALLSAKTAHFDGDVDGFLSALPEPNAAPCALGEDRRNAFFAYGEHGLGQMLADVRDHDHQLAAFGRSYWWTGGNDYVGPGMIALEGMPDVAGFMAMLRGFGPPARVQQPAAAARPAAAAASAGAGATARGRETTVPPRDLIGDAEEAEAAAAWGAESSREELAWAAPSDAVDDAWTEAITGDDAESPFDLPEEEWDFPDAGPAKPEAPASEAEAPPEPEREPEEEPAEDLFDAGPEPYGIGAAETGEDVYSSLSEPGETAETEEEVVPWLEDEPEAEEVAAEESGDDEVVPWLDSPEKPAAESAPSEEPEAPEDPASETEETEEDNPAADIASKAEAVPPSTPAPEPDEEPGDIGHVVDVSMVSGDDDFDIPGDDPPEPEEPEADAVNEAQAEAVTEDETVSEGAEDVPDDVKALETNGDDTADSPDTDGPPETVTPAGEGEDSPFGKPGDEDDDDEGLGRKKSGIRGFFSLRGRGKD